MKHATATLSGAMLDQAAAMALGWTFSFYATTESPPDHPGPTIPRHLYRVSRPGRDTLGMARLMGGQWAGVPRYSTDWTHGGPLIEAHRIDLSAPGWREGGVWWASGGEGSTHILRQGPTPLIAAMRALVASKLGDEVDL